MSVPLVIDVDQSSDQAAAATSTATVGDVDDDNDNDDDNDDNDDNDDDDDNGNGSNGYLASTRKELPTRAASGALPTLSSLRDALAQPGSAAATDNNAETLTGAVQEVSVAAATSMKWLEYVRSSVSVWGSELSQTCKDIEGADGKLAALATEVQQLGDLRDNIFDRLKQQVETLAQQQLQRQQQQQQQSGGAAAAVDFGALFGHAAGEY
jgi:hypothetical protein